MGVYSNITIEDVNDILKHYQVDQAVEFSATTQGISNSNFKVKLKSGSFLLLKISNDKTIKQLENEQQILLTLKKYNFSFAIPPLETIMGKPIYTHGDYYGVVFHFVPGLPPIVSQSSIKQLGMSLGLLHSIDIHKDDLQSIRQHEVVGHNGLSIAEFCLSNKCPDDFKEVYNNLFPKGLEDLPYDFLPAGIIHGDLYYDNSLFNEGKIITLIDFEQAGVGRFILDVGIAISGSCLDGDKVDEGLMKAFLEGYLERRKMTHLESEYLYTAIIIGFLSIALWRIERFYEGKLDESKRFNYRELLRRAILFKKQYSLD